MSAASTQPILEVSNLTKRFGGVTALDNISFALYPGEVMALAGDNGAGKSTLIKCISGVYIPEGGMVKLEGRERHFSEPREARAVGIETIYQDLALADNLDVGANIFLGREPMKKRFGFPFLDRAKMRQEAKIAVEKLEIHTDLDRPVNSLSGGQRQAVAIARAVYWQAKVLIMDEPTAALGVPEQRKVVELIQRLKAQGVAIIFISHNLHDIFAVSDRIMVLLRGTKAGERNAKETNGDELVKMMVGSA
jgi:ABC-type sugar transport system ATPase subunit